MLSANHILEHYSFYQRGWRGLAIDPNPHFKKAWDHYRPGDVFLNFAISKTHGKMAYLVNERFPAMNMVVDEDQISEIDSSQYRVSACEAIPLSEILDRYLKGNRIDLLNVDCEGRDVEVLETNDFEKYRPTVIAIEDTSISLESKASQLLQAIDYECRAYIGLTKIFQDKTQRDCWRDFHVDFPAERRRECQDKHSSPGA